MAWLRDDLRLPRPSKTSGEGRDWRRTRARGTSSSLGESRPISSNLGEPQKSSHGTSLHSSSRTAPSRSISSSSAACLAAASAAARSACALAASAAASSTALRAAASTSSRSACTLAACTLAASAAAASACSLSLAASLRLAEACISAIICLISASLSCDDSKKAKSRFSILPLAGSISSAPTHRSMASSLGLTSTRGMSVSMPAPKAYEYFSGGTFGYALISSIGFEPRSASSVPAAFAVSRSAAASLLSCCGLMPRAVMMASVMATRSASGRCARKVSQSASVPSAKTALYRNDGETIAI
mmetsp:Transcript_24188/g.77627  ORF Transcript_24188/g.77627 Transcript_24188/m.77627 type:complete len:302 (+) Transcript_24188:171-1076(+)